MISCGSSATSYGGANGTIPRLEESQCITTFLDTWLPRLQGDSTRSYATIAFGCTGGRHRSVYLAEALARHFSGWQGLDVVVQHVEMEKLGQ